jgi:hypothetical protein
MRVEGANPNLDQPASQALLHDPGEGTRVGEPISLEVLVQVGMGIKVQDGERGIAPAHGPENGVGDEMVSSERQRPPALRQGRADGTLDLGTVLGSGEQGDIPGITQRLSGQILSHLAPGVPVR